MSSSDKRLSLLPPQAGVSFPRVLFVDDEPLFLGLLPRLFDDVSLNIDIRTARDGFHALTMLHTWGEPAVVVSDYRMPRMDGLTLLDSVVHFWPSARTILYTAMADGDVVLEAASSRHRVVTKNMWPDLFRQIVLREVRRWLRR